MSPATSGAALGALAAGGLLLIVRAWRHRRPALAERVAPYLRGHLADSALLVGAGGGLAGLGGTAGRLLSRLAGLADELLGGTASVRRRLDAAGDSRSVADFRAEQVLCAGAGLVVGLVIAGAAAAGGRVSPIALAAGCLASTVAGVFIRDRWLTRDVRRRETRILAELPTVAELLALAVSAGEGPLAALDRVARVGNGELVGELRRSLAEVRSGVPLAAALQEASRRSSLPIVARFLDGLVVAIERGTPLADVLHAQARDVREGSKRSLLESAGRREIAMLFPVVFLILPVVVVFALFPGFYTLSFNVP